MPDATAPSLSRPVGVTLDIIAAQIGPLEGLSILDVGCGGGGLARALSAKGAKVTGVDPQDAALTIARSRAPDAEFQQAGAEALPFPDASFDRVVFLNSLHHVPVPLMGAALKEAVRVSKGPVLVIEPLAEGPFFRAMLPVEDETPIRAAAQAALAAAVETGEVRRLASGEYDDVRRFADADAFLAMIVAVDPARTATAERERARVTELVAQEGAPTEGGVLLPQPHRFDLLAR